MVGYDGEGTETEGSDQEGWKKGVQGGDVEELSSSRQRPVRNMGNFNLFQTHVLTFFHQVEQCCYPSFLITPHILAMTSHVAYVIYATFTLITTQGLCKHYIFLMSFFFLCIQDRTFTMTLTFSFPSSYPCRLTHSV